MRGDRAAEGEVVGSSLALFVKRLRHPQLIDWHEAAINVVFCLVKPSKIAEMAHYRFRTRGFREKQDPGIFLYIMYLAVISEVMYVAALRLEAEDAQEENARWSLGELSVNALAHLVMPNVYLLLLMLGWTTLLYCFLRTSQSTNSLASVRLFAPKALRRAIRPPDDHEEQLDVLDHLPRKTLNPHAARASWLYCFDLVCHATLPLLTVLAVIQYILLPIAVLVSSPSVSVQFLSALCSNALHFVAAVCSTYSIALGTAILPPPICNRAILLFVPLVVWLAVILLLTLFRYNLTILYLNVLYGGTPKLPPRAHHH